MDLNVAGRLRSSVPLSAHTTWRVGGPADYFFEPANVDDLAVFLQYLPESMPVFWLGLGSNLLIRDGGLRGVVICLGKGRPEDRT
jgi:UDP-N-acetylmuramate dehydrogenase